VSTLRLTASRPTTWRPFRDALSEPRDTNEIVPCYKEIDAILVWDVAQHGCEITSQLEAVDYEEKDNRNDGPCPSHGWYEVELCHPQVGERLDVSYLNLGIVKPRADLLRRQ
jgi:hypothetical protein